MCFGPFSKLCHWGPISALLIIKCVTGMTVHCSNLIWPAKTPASLLNTLCFTSLAGLTIYNFLSAIAHGPGFLPLNWKPEDIKDAEFMQFCGSCHSYKAPRSHHCRKCNRCVLKMDHHCPWINTCVGWGNHAHFVAFLASATLGSLHASCILGYTLYRSIYRVYYIQNHIKFIPLGLYGTICCILSLGFANGVVIAVGALLYFQLRAIIRNRTGIEDWILEKALYRRRKTGKVFVFPYDLGVVENVKQVLSFTCNPVGNGVVWKVRDGCDQYTLTREQLKQKMEKRSRSRVYVAIKPASGCWLPISHGFATFFRPPCTDEERIQLEIGDEILVTRWRKHWMFGEKLQTQTIDVNRTRLKGWFPRICVCELHRQHDDVQQHRKSN